MPHDDPGLEARLPKAVKGRELASWSLAGWCWVEESFGSGDGFARAASEIHESGVDINELRIALVGRGDTRNDPPYFVWVIQVPASQDADALAVYLLAGAMGAVDPTHFADDRTWKALTVGGKKVQVGSAELVDQSDHQRGKPYIYETDSYLFAILADDPAWAADALRQLP